MNFMDFFDEEYLPKLGGRAATFRAVMREATFLGVSTIVETGSVRKKNNWEGDGQSTIIFNSWALQTKNHFSTVDIDISEVVRVDCTCASWFEMDSVKFLQTNQIEIDLLYLDSLDVDMQFPHEAALHTLMELMAAMPQLHKNSIVFIDDSPIDDRFRINGKGMYVAQYFDKLGVKPFTFGYQSAWRMP